MAQRIDGKRISAELREQVRREVALLGGQGISVCLAVMIVGEDPASKIYVRNKKKACEELGIQSQEYALPAETSQEALLDLVEQLNQDPAVNGILVQLPLPAHIDEKSVLEAISPKKDVDAFHPINVGRIMIGSYDFLPCTPAGCMELIHSTGTEVSGKRCVVGGISNIVGKPMAMLLLHESGTVTVCHSRTENLAEICRSADILVAAAGKAGLITGDMIKPGAVVIDVGMNRDGEGGLCGDVDAASAEPVAGWLTPVPGGVGPMTITMLMRNTVTAARLQWRQTARALPSSTRQGD